MTPTTKIVLLWIAFAGAHMGLSSLPVRRAILSRIGERAFQGTYSLIAFALLIPLVRIYFAHKHAGDWLWVLSRGAAVRWTMYAGMGVAFVFLVASFVRPSPAGVVPGDPKPSGIYRIVRHPLFMAFAIFALTHLLPNGSTADVSFFGGFVLFALVGAWHQDRRKLAMNVSGYREFCAETPFLPFTGRSTAQGLRELSPVVVVVGLGLAALVRYFHASWFGG